MTDGKGLQLGNGERERGRDFWNNSRHKLSDDSGGGGATMAVTRVTLQWQ